MRSRFHKRRHRRTWFPVEGQEAAGEGLLPPGEFWAMYTGSLVNQPTLGGARASTIAGLTFDLPPEELGASGSTQSLSDWQGSAWQLGGIVGKFHCAIRPKATAQALQLYQQVLVMAWFAVLKVDDTGTPRETDLLTYDPMLASNIRQPYVWRRSWMLGRGAKDVPGTTIVESDWPSSNALYGSASDGPHIEAKSGRFIGEDDRLFFGVNSVPLADPAGTGFEPTFLNEGLVVDWVLDYRLLGILRKATNRKDTSI